MKIKVLFLTAFILTGPSLPPFIARTADAFLLTDQATAGTYCDISFPPPQEDRFAMDAAFLRNHKTGRRTEFHGECDEGPVRQQPITNRPQDREQHTEHNSSE